MDDEGERPTSSKDDAPVRLILAVDVGSSGIRCCAYRLEEEEELSPPTSSEGCHHRHRVRAMPGCSSSRPRRSVEPNTGRILLHCHRDQGGDEGTSSSSLLDDVDSCVDETLDLIRSEFGGGDGDHPGSPGSPGGTFEVVGVGFSSFTMNLIGVDVDGEVVEGATFSYACNVPEVSEECRGLRSDLGTEKLEALHQRTGCVVHSAYALPQLRHFYRTRRSGSGKDGSVVKVHRWQTIAALCLRRWSGLTTTLPMSYSEASWTGLLDVHTCTWDYGGVLDLLPRECIDALPPLGDCTDPDAIPGGIREFRGGGDCVGGRERNPYWDRWPELRGGFPSGDVSKGCRLFLGVADGACANLGSKCSHPSRVAVTVGTSAAARVCLPLPRTRAGTGTSSRPDGDVDDDEGGGGSSMSIPKGLFCYRVDGDHVVVGGALSDGGSVVEWARDLLNLNDDDQFGRCMEEVEKLCAARDADGGGEHIHRLSVVPFLSGERSTGYRDGATGCVRGLTRETTPAIFLKACMEGVTLRLGEIVRLIDGIWTVHDASTTSSDSSGEGNDGGSSAGLIVASGGALEKNTVWRQMIADCTGRTVVMDSDVHESTSRGAARLVVASLSSNEKSRRGGGLSSVPSMAEEELSPVDVAEPAPDRRFWHEAADVQDEFIESMSPLWR